MTPEVSKAVLRSLLADATPGPWWRFERIGASEDEHMVWLTNEGQDTLMLDANDVAVLLNAMLLTARQQKP